MAVAQGWGLNSYSISSNFIGYFTATITVTNESSSPQLGVFTLTVRQAGKMVATLRGFVASTPAHQTVYVQMVSTDHYVPGPYTVEFKSIS